MERGNEMHQQFIKDFIHSLQTSGEDRSNCVESRSHSESSLNPNAEEFVPSYLKTCEDDKDEANYGDGDDKHGVDLLKFKQPLHKLMVGSTTTLVNNEAVGEPVEDTLSRIQRQFFNMMNQLANQKLSLSEIQFSLTPNGQGISVQFIVPDNGKHQLFDKHLCRAAGLRLKVDDCSMQTNQPGSSLANKFLNRMGDVLSGKPQAKSPSICPKCIAKPKLHSFSELEIDRQIEDIKAFEKLINEDAGARYQGAFKELCQKLGLNTNGENSMDYESADAGIVDEPTNEDDNEMMVNEDEDQTNYEWDSFTPDLTPTKVYRYAASNVEQPRQHLKVDVQVPFPTAAKSSSSGNASSVYPKLYNVNQSKWNSGTSQRKSAILKESKIQRWRFSSPTVIHTAAGAAAAVLGAAVGSTAAAATAASSAGTSEAKKLIDRRNVSPNRFTRTYQRNTLPKSSNVAEMPGGHSTKSNGNCKLKPRTQIMMAKQKVEQGHSSKLSKATPLGRTVGVGQMQSNRHSKSESQRTMVPRSTHASQMRQSEVKRRLNLMKGDKVTDVQFNDYLFK